MGAALAVAIASAPVGPVHAQSVDPNLWATNGYVWCMAREGNTIYLGGTFTLVGPATGGAAVLDAGSGAPLPSFPKVLGTVTTVVPDGTGGWFIGGSFTAVGGLARSRLAHVAADMTVTPWNPNADGTVVALALDGSTVYAGGDFTNVGGQARGHLAALDAITGAATSWNPAPTSIYGGTIVRTLTVGGGMVYVGGNFTSIGGQARTHIAAFDAGTGAVTSWDPNANGYVAVIVSDGGTVYVGGGFLTIGGQTRKFVAALDAATGAATSWIADASGGSNPGPDVLTLALGAGVVYAGGDFTGIGGAARNGIAALDKLTGTATSWNPNAAGQYGIPYVRSLAVSGSTVYAGGHFTTIGGQTRAQLAALDAVTGAATSWNPGLAGWNAAVNGAPFVLALAVNGGTVFAGGTFTMAGGGVARNNIAALDATTGAATAWNPNASGTVSALSVSGSTVYAGGSFTSIGGQARLRAAALDAGTGTATGWDPSANGDVRSLAVSGSTVYAGGFFTTIGGQTRNRIAALDAGTGAATAWDPNANSVIYALTVSGPTVYAGGFFTTIGGQTRNRIAALDAASGAATTWNPNASGTVNALAVVDTALYAGGEFTTIGGKARSYIAALDLTAGAANGWNPGATYYVNALGIGGSSVYAGGGFLSIGGQPRSRIAALDAITGLATTWNPNAGSTVFALTVNGPTVYAGGVFTAIGGFPQSGLARMTSESTVGVSPVTALVDASTRAWPNPFRRQVTISFGLTAPAEVRLDVLDVLGRRVWSSPRTWLAVGRHSLAWDGRSDDGRSTAGGLYFLRVRGPGLEIARRVVRVN